MFLLSFMWIIELCALFGFLLQPRNLGGVDVSVVLWLGTGMR